MMYTWSLAPRGIMEIEGMWKHSKEENVRIHIDERTEIKQWEPQGTSSTPYIVTEEDLDGLDMHTNFGRETWWVNVSVELNM